MKLACGARAVACRFVSASGDGANGHAVVDTALGLLRASFADRVGDLEGYIRALVDLADAPRDLWSASVAATWRRVGLETHGHAIAGDGQPMLGRIRRLGLDRPRDRLLAVGSQLFLAAETDPLPAGCQMLLDVELGRLSDHKGGVCTLTPQATQILAAMVEEPAGLSLEALYAAGWGSQKDFHPLRHRNAIYVALQPLTQHHLACASISRSSFAAASCTRWREPWRCR